MFAHELSRRHLDDGTTDVEVALGVDQQAHIIVPTSMLDTPGYEAMLNAHLAKWESRVRLREGEAIE
jgi:hypothetical protein